MAGRELETLRTLRNAGSQARQSGDSLMQARIFTALGRAHEYIGNLDSAFGYYKKALLIWEIENDSNYNAGGNQQIAQVLRIINWKKEA